MMPSISRVAFIYDPKVAPGGGSYYTKLVEAAAHNFKWRLLLCQSAV